MTQDNSSSNSSTSSSRIERAAYSRIERSRTRIVHTLRCVERHNPLAAEFEPKRLLARLKSKAMLSSEEAENIVAGITARSERDESGARPRRDRAGPERIYGGTVDFVGVSFLERGFMAARAVARVAYPDGSPLGTGFMISDRLFLTNNHVISSETEAAGLVVEFGYELDPADKLREATRFKLDPSTFFLTDSKDDLDYTIVAIGERLSGARELDEFGWCALSDATDKHALGEFANVVQHPQGRYKEVVLRENRLVSRLDTVIHYVADTEPGSSGSPVFNNEWRVIALHHWGGPWRQKVDSSGLQIPTEVNEGIRASAIVRELRAKASGLPASRSALLQRLIDIRECWEGPSQRMSRRQEERDGSPRIDSTGLATWRVPFEISVRLPWAIDGAAPMAPPFAPEPSPPAVPTAERAPDSNYANRKGYKPGFIPGCTVPMPALSKAQQKVAARVQTAEPGDDPFELKYNHFSVVINGERRLAYFTACNIDGKTAKDIDRKTGTVTNYTPGGGTESIDAGAEASERWFGDERLLEENSTNQDLYSSQEVPGFKKGTKAWMNRMLQRGHLVRRVDPAWGTNDQALKAEADTFHFTNCTPQVGFFNMGSAPQGTPKSAGGQLWRAIEDYVRDNAAVDDLRVCVFTGPVLDAKDPLWREDVLPGFRVPLRFWKVVVWAEKGKLRSVAMLADQEPVLTALPEAIGAGEAYADTSAVEDFVTTIAHLEQVTGLDFGDEVRKADIRGGESLGKKRGARVRATKRVVGFDEVFGAARRAKAKPYTLIPKSRRKSPARGSTKRPRRRVARAGTK
jgi:endonuclease G